MSSEKPDGAISGILYQHDRQLRAVENHGAAEGHAVGTREVLDSYDRALHPWIHGRRPHDLIARVRKVIPDVE